MIALLTGIYRNGSIELLETPQGVREGRVRILLIEDGEARPASGQMRYGQFGGGGLPILGDFEVAEWHGHDTFDGQAVP